jgi:hypothetical protein
VYETQNDRDNQEWIIQSHTDTWYCGLFILDCPCRSVLCTHWYLILWISHSCLPLSFCVVYTLVLDTLDYSFLIEQEWIIQSIKYQCVHDRERQGQSKMNNPEYQVPMCTRHRTTGALFILDYPCRSVSRTHWYLILWIIHSWLPLSFCVVYTLVLDTLD